jgi:hypothetical protein
MPCIPSLLSAAYLCTITEVPDRKRRVQAGFTFLAMRVFRRAPKSDESIALISVESRRVNRIVEPHSHPLWSATPES